MKTVIEMAKACGIPEFENNESQAENIMRFAELVRADEREVRSMRWDEYIAKAIAAEREACAKVCEQGVDTEHPTVKGHIMKDFGASKLLAAAIRARSNT